MSIKAHPAFYLTGPCVRQASQTGQCGLSLVQRPSMMQPWTSTDGLALNGWPGAEDGAEGVASGDAFRVQ